MTVAGTVMNLRVRKMLIISCSSETVCFSRKTQCIELDMLKFEGEGHNSSTLGAGCGFRERICSCRIKMPVDL
jgi:hypothetical protein